MLGVCDGEGVDTTEGVPDWVPVLPWDAVSVGVSVPDPVEPWLRDCVCEGVCDSLPVDDGDSDAVRVSLAVCDAVPESACEGVCVADATWLLD